jgi:DNA mismatch repair protein MutH
MTTFDPNAATDDEILSLADELRGLTLGQIPGSRFEAAEDKRGKGEAGAAIEAFFRIVPNSVADADFLGAGIELKAVPLVEKGEGLRVKERTAISMIDYASLASETWETAHVRRKLHILFVFFQHLYDTPKTRFPIRHVALWKPEGEVLDQIHSDWDGVRDKVLAGLAHEISEGDGKILGACTKGQDAAHGRKQPNSDIEAASRAFALKPWFTMALYEDTHHAHIDIRQLAELSNLDRFRQAFRRFEGRLIADVAHELGIKPSKGKSYAASVVHRAVAAAAPVGRSELEEAWTIKISRVDADLYPYESLSFPAFTHFEVAEEDWEDSDLLSRIERMLLVPVFGGTRQTPQDDCVIRSPVYWEPTAEQLDRIRREWTMFRDQIRSGGAGSLLKESETNAIHVRPHGRDSTDRDPIPGGGDQAKKSFWLNKRFVQEILRGGR